MTRRKLVDVTGYMKRVCEGAGVPWNDTERFIVPVSLWRKMVKLLRLDDYIQEEDNDNARSDDTAA